jgi:hypothetical protein
MKPTLLKIFFYCSMLMLGSVLSAKGQILSALNISTDSVINIGREKLVSLSIKITSDQGSNFKGQIVPVLPQGFGLVSDQPIKISVLKNTQTFYPFKFLVLQNADTKIRQMTFQLKDSTGKVVSQFKAKVNMLPQRAVELAVLNPSVLLRQVGDSLNLKVMIRNSGNQTEALKVVASFPADNGQGKQMVQKDLQLSPGASEEVTFARIINRELYQLNNFYINIAGLYQNGELFGNGIAYVQNASANRQFVNAQIQQNNLNGAIDNQISLSGQNLFSDSQSWQLNGTGSTQIGRGVMGFSLDAYQWNSINNKPLISNTWLNYEGAKSGITAGNISENLESFFNGRGVKVYSRSDEDTHGFEAAMVQKSYNLLGDNFDYGYAAYIKTNHKDTSGRQYNSTLIFDYAPLEQSRSLLSANSLSLFNKRNLLMSVNFGAGASQSLLDNNDIKPSFALGTNLSGSYKKFNFSSNNFYSTAYYPGIRRGVLQLNERISRYLGSQHVWAGFSYYSFNPAYQRNIFFFQRDYALQRVEAGWAKPLNINLNITLTASRDQESANYNTVNQESSTLISYRLNESLNWHSNDFKQNIYVSVDNGISKGIDGDSQLQLRLNANWSNSWLNLSAYLQRGNFLLAEAYNSNLGTSDINRYSISPSLHRYFFDNKLRTEAGLIFYHDKQYGYNLTYTAKAEYLITPKTAFYVSTYQYHYNTPYISSSFSSLQAGITQKLPNPKQHTPGKKGNLEIFFFKDNNHNGSYDAGEEAANSGTVLINGIIFMIPANGTIVYSKVPYGSYQLSMPMQNGYQISPVQVKVDQKNNKIILAMQKSGNAVGKIAISIDEQKSLQTNASLSGITLLVRSSDGTVRTVKTGEGGQYSLYLPEGTYQIYPDNTQLPENIYYEGANAEVAVVAGNESLIPTLTLKVRQKKVEIKRFKN